MNYGRVSTFLLSLTLLDPAGSTLAWARPDSPALEVANTGTPTASVGEADFFEPSWKNKVLARVRFDESGDERKTDDDRYIYNVNPEGYILGSDVLEFLRPLPRSEFKQLLMSQGYDVSNLDTLYARHQDEMKKNVESSLDRVFAILALNRIIDNEAMKTKVELETDNTILRNRAFYVFKTILTKAAIYTGKISEKEEAVKTESISCDPDEDTDCIEGKKQQIVTERIPTQDVSRTPHTDLYPELLKIQQWNALRLKYAIRTILIQGAAMSGKIGYETKSYTDPATHETREIRYATEDVSQKTEEELYEYFKEYASKLSIRSIKINWDSIRGGLAPLRTEVVSLPDQHLWERDCTGGILASSSPNASWDGFRIAGFDPTSSPLPATYAEFRDAIQKRMQSQFACRQSFNVVRWDYPYSVNRDLYNAVAQPQPVATNFFTGEVVEDNNRPHNPIAVSIDSLPNESILFLNRVTAQMRGDELLWQRMNVWRKLARREGIRALRIAYAPPKDEKQKLYDLIKDRAFTQQSISVKGIKLVLGGSKQKEYHERLVALIREKNEAFIKAHPKATAEELRAERKSALPALLAQMETEFAAAIRSKDLTLLSRPVEFSSDDAKPSPSVVRQTMLSLDMVNLEKQAIFPFAREMTPSQNRVLGFVTELNVSTPVILPISDTRVQNQLSQILGAKYEAIAQREAAYQLFKKNDVEFLRGTCTDPRWPCQSSSDRKWVNLLFPEQPYPGMQLGSSTLGDERRWSQVMSVSTDSLKAVLTIKNERRYVAPEALND